jgi:hypothetical protein
LRADKCFRKVLLAFLIVVALAAAVYAAPTGPDEITIGRSERMQPKQGAIVPATAGNVTELNINATSVTKSWQGYYGNVTGVLTLDDALNRSMYEWFDASPQGEIYASPSQVANWQVVKCFNYSAYLPEINLTGLEESLGIRPGDADGVNETFSSDFTGSFWVGNKLIDATSSCHAAFTYVNAQSQAADFVEVLLTQGTSVIYAAILEDNANGFDSRPHDFQMLVGEDGHNGDTSPTNYYFYVELE